jgi:hypothetical protein
MSSLGIDCWLCPRLEVRVIVCAVVAFFIVLIASEGAPAFSPHRTPEEARYNYDVGTALPNRDAAKQAVADRGGARLEATVAPTALAPGHVYDAGRDLVAPRTTSGLADDVLDLGDDALDGLSASQRRSVQSLQTNIAEHEAKLTAYIANPDAYDNLGYLANAPSDAVRQSIIQGRVRHLKNEITAFADQIRKLTGGG